MMESRPMNGLIIRTPWIEMILDGKKIWEIRGRLTHVRGKIALIRGGSGLIVGTCNLVGVAGPLTLREFQNNASKAGFTASQMTSLPYEKTYAWVLSNVIKLRRPIPYKHPSGAVIWVKLPEF
jgi:hypothetical protein